MPEIRNHSAATTAGSGWRLALVREGRRREDWRWAPLVCAGLYVVALLATLSSVVAAIYRNADIAAAPEIGELSARAPGYATTILGNAPWFSALWFEQLTRWVPGHRTLWELTPWVLTLVGIGLVAWAAARVAGRWAGAVIAVTCACAGAQLLPLQFAWSIHAVAYVHICLLGAYLVPLALDQFRDSDWRREIGLAVLVILVTGIGMASDKLVIIGGLVPFVLAGLVLWRLSPSRSATTVLATVLGVAIGSSVVAVLAKAVATSQHVTSAPFPISFAPLTQLPGHLGDLVGSLAVLANGDFGGQSVSLTSLLTLLAAGAVGSGVVAVLRHGRELLPLTLTPLARSDEPESAARAAFLSYWTASAVVVSSAFVLSGIPRGLTTGRYVVTVSYAVVVIVAVWAGRARRRHAGALVAVGSSVIILASALSLVQSQIQSRAYAAGSTSAQQLAQFAAREHLTTGYAGYWDASALSWELHNRVTIYPLITCGTSLCPFPYHKINTWYVPRPLAGSFFVVDSRLLRLGAYGALTGPPASWGTPTQVAHFGPLTVYVYPYNLASKLLPA